MMKDNKIKEDFVVRFANVNGSGSATANTLFSRVLINEGVPVGIKNIFPSNIQGLPTWFETRISPKGYLGRKGSVDILVAMNVNSMEGDLKQLAAGAFVIYDSSAVFRIDVFSKKLNLVPVPVQKLATACFGNNRNRLLLQNMVYVGALLRLFDLSLKKGHAELRKIYKNESVVEQNKLALKLGYDYVDENFHEKWPFKLKSKIDPKDYILVDGNEAAGLACVAAGATVASWYPITPSTSLVDAYSKYCERYRMDEMGKRKFAIVQAEDEIAAVGIAMGASWNGARAFTATSGPGVSLMNELLGYAFYTEIPLVLFNIQRCGPSTGMPTRTQQADLLLCAYASHGDTKHILLFPKDPEECFLFTLAAFDLAEQLQTTVIVMSDLDIGMNLKMSKPFRYPEGYYNFDRGKVLSKQDLDNMDTYYRYYDYDNDGIPYRTISATHPSKGAYLTRGSGHDRFGKYTENGDLYSDNLDRIFKKIKLGRNFFPKNDRKIRDRKKECGCIYIGSTHDGLVEAFDALNREGHPINTLRITAFPFRDDVQKFIDEHKKIFVIDQNATNQLAQLLQAELKVNPDKLVKIAHYDGQPIAAKDIKQRIEATI